MITTFRLAFRISHSLPQQGEVEKHGHSMFLEVSFQSPNIEKSAEILEWRSKVKAALKKLEAQWDGAWIDDFFEPATSENFVLFIHRQMQKDPDLKDVVALALQETSRNRFELKAIGDQ